MCKAASGGSGLRKLVPLECPKAGYDIQTLKEEIRSSTIYIIPLNEDIDDCPLSINDITTDNGTSMAKCISCNKDIPLSSFSMHKLSCTTDYKEDLELEAEKEDDIERRFSNLFKLLSLGVDLTRLK